MLFLGMLSFLHFVSIKAHVRQVRFVWSCKYIVLTGTPKSTTEEDLNLISAINVFGFTFAIVNFPFISRNIPGAYAYGVYISQLIGYSRACVQYNDCFNRADTNNRIRCS
jgi:hypothetical protein